MMDEREAVKLFLDNGFQISKDVLPLVISEPQFIINEINKLNPRPFIVTQDHIKKIKNRTEERIDINDMRIYSYEKKELNINDFANSYAIKYEKLSKLIQKNNNLEKLVSINKITPKTTEFCIIGIVRDKLQNQMVVEDTTGELEIHFDLKLKEKMDDIELDDAAGFKCRRMNSKFNLEHIYYPDIELDRKINRSKNDINILLLPDNFVNLELIGDVKTNLYFSFDTNSLLLDMKKETEKLVKTEINQPRLIEINTVKTLFLPKIFYERHQITVSSFDIEIFLKKRYIIPKNEKIFNTAKTDFVLEEIPDMVVTNIEPAICKNYKGTSIISVGDYKIYSLNLKTREVIKIE